MNPFTGLFDNVLIGLETALSVSNLVYCFVGVFAGMLLGIIPGIGNLVALSLLFPVTFHLEPTAALIMLAGIFYGTTYGGSTASILLNVPGTPANAVACLDGYPMAQQGRAGIALLMTTVASFAGGSAGIVLMMLFSPVIAESALLFGSWEYFALMVLGLVAASAISEGSPLKGFAMVVLGALLGIVGLDLNTATPRFVFGITAFFDGISLVAVAMGLFGVSEVIVGARAKQGAGITRHSITYRSMIPTRDDVRRSWFPMLRGSSIGAFFGILPGMGGLIACFMAYAVEKRVADDPSRFGKGAVEGIMAPEAANNAADQTALIPTLTLGIPGTASMAIIIAVLMIHGITPGPTLVLQRPELFWGLVMSFWIGNIMLVVLNIPLIGLFIKVLLIPRDILYPSILMFICIGVYSVSYNVLDIWVVFVAGGVGYFMRLCGYSPAPLILGFVLGPLMEVHLRRSLLLSGGDLTLFVTRPISGTILAVTLVILALAIWSSRRQARRQAALLESV